MLWGLILVDDIYLFNYFPLCRSSLRSLSLDCRFQTNKSPQQSIPKTFLIYILILHARNPLPSRRNSRVSRCDSFQASFMRGACPSQSRGNTLADALSGDSTSTTSLPIVFLHDWVRYLVASLWPATRLACSVGVDGSAIMSRPYLGVLPLSVVIYPKVIVLLLLD